MSDDAEHPDRLRASAADIYERVKHDAAEELVRPVPALALSGLFAGATVGFGAVASAAAASAVGGSHDARLVGALFFPIGFIVVIVGRAQLFTENTLYPVTLVLDERRHLVATLRLWVVVLIANLIGAFLFALLMAKSGALSTQVASNLAHDGHTATIGSWMSFFWRAVIGGWLIALVAWLVQAGAEVVGQVMLIWMLAFVFGLLRLDHCVSTTIEVFISILKSEVQVGRAAVWLAVVILGNAGGGVLIVALLNYGQVRAGER